MLFTCRLYRPCRCRARRFRDYVNRKQNSGSAFLHQPLNSCLKKVSRLRPLQSINSCFRSILSEKIIRIESFYSWPEGSKYNFFSFNENFLYELFVYFFYISIISLYIFIFLFFFDKPGIETAKNVILMGP